MIFIRSIQKNIKRDANYLDFRVLGKNLADSFLHLIYPSKCLHCRTLISPEPAVLCASCASLLELVPLHDRCPNCFNLFDGEESSLRCGECATHTSYYIRMAAAFDYIGPPASLVKRLKYFQQPYLARGMAAFLVAQLEMLEWPYPDALIPVPQSWSRWFERGYNQSQLLAEEMGRLIQRPVWKCLKRKSGDFSQAALSIELRKNLDKERFQIKNHYPFEGKKLLVIDDVMTSGLTLQRCGEILYRANPSALYALTFCRALK